MIRKPFKGTWFYEWQIGPVVLQVRHTRASQRGGRENLVGVWLDPHWRRG